MKKVLKFVSLALCIAMFCGIFAACGQTEEPSQTAAGGEEVSDAPDDGSSYVFTGCYTRRGGRPRVFYGDLVCR